jgi:polyisoprenoid-binding protein YceI
MRNVIVLISMILGLMVSMIAQGGEYKLDESHAHLGFKIRHLGFSNVRGNFDKFSGTGTFDEKKHLLSKLDVTIEASSINTNESDRDRHLRNPDFFHVKKYPQLKFVSTKVTYSKGVPSKIEGNFTMRGVTKNIVLTVDEWGGKMEDAWGNQRIAFAASGKIDRREFGLTWNKGLKKLAGVTVGNEVKLELEIQAIKMD